MSYGQDVGWNLQGEEDNRLSRKLSQLDEQLLFLLLLPGLLFTS